MQEEINTIIEEKLKECGGNIDKLEKSLSNYFKVPIDDIHTNIKITIPVPDEMINRIKPEPINVNLNLNVKDAEISEDDIEESRQEGIYEGKLEIARSLLEYGMSFEETLKITGLTDDDLDNL